MTIVGNSKPVNELILNLHSTDTRLQLYTEPFPYVDRIDLDRPARATITFEDSREINQLIDALTKFKERNIRYIGHWK